MPNSREVHGVITCGPDDSDMRRIELRRSPGGRGLCFLGGLAGIVFVWMLRLQLWVFWRVLRWGVIVALAPWVVFCRVLWMRVDYERADAMGR
jgi:hypothetical protein